MKQLIIILLTVFSIPAFSQKNWSVYDILGNKINIDHNKIYLSIGCDSRNCHDCIIALGYYCSKLAEENSSIETIFVLKGGSIGEMRSIFTAVKEYVPDGVPIYFDLNPKRKEILIKEKYDFMPILIVLKPNGRRHYFSYKDLFYNVEEGEPIDVNTSRKIRKLLFAN